MILASIHPHLIATLEETIEVLEGEIARALASFRGAVARSLESNCQVS